MQAIRKILKGLYFIFEQHYPWIAFYSAFTLVLTGFLHFELKQHNKDFSYWKSLLQSSYQEIKLFDVMLILLIIFVLIIFVSIIMMSNTHTMHWYDELSQLEVKKRYADFLLLRLIADIDIIERKYLRNNDKSSILALKSFILAHDDMKARIEVFRKDARKLLTPSELEITMPIEEVYGALENEIQYVTHSKFYTMNIEADENKIRKLVNP